MNTLISFDTSKKKDQSIIENSNNKNKLPPYIEKYCCIEEIKHLSLADISDGRMLGILCIRDENGRQSYGMAARYAEISTPENPIIQVCVNRGGTERGYYNITINKIDPNCAAELEMFALCSYTDDQKSEMGRIFGFWQTLKNYDINASLNSGEQAYTVADTFYAMKKDWVRLCKDMMEEYARAGISKQYKDGMGLMSMFTNNLKKK